LKYLLVLFSLFASIRAEAQTIDPYRRLTDPRAITYLDGDDAEPLHYRTGIAWPGDRDPTDDYFIVAEGKGAGILTHIWMQLEGKEDTVTNLKIYIDDTLVVQSHLYSFFKKQLGPLRAPFDSLQSGGLVCDVQMPYKRSYKITYWADWGDCCLFWAVGWRPVKDPALLEAFSLTPSATAEQQQKKAEEVYWSGESPWKGLNVETLSAEQQLSPGEALERVISGPGIITELHFKPSTYDIFAIRSLWIEIYWDDNPEASVNVPFADFFGAGSGMRDVRSHPIRTKKNGMLTCYFPMPFAVGAKIRLVNKGLNDIGISMTAKYSKEPIDRSRMGYFAVQFNEKRDLRYHVYQPVGYHQGRGRFVGMQLYLPIWQPGYFLEGDPLFHIDSSLSNYTRYTGSEDYFNGGWFFSDGPLTLPFAGCTEIHTSLYRFHYMDAVDFKSSFQLLLQHGTKNDFKAWYRTVAYFYNQWTPFWTSRDTVRYGETLRVSGSGYQPNESIVITLGETELLTVSANEKGKIDVSTVINSPIKIGGHAIAINGYKRPKPIWVIDKPDVYFVRDTFPAYVNWQDTIEVYGTGFPADRAVSVYLDSIQVEYTSKITTDARGKFRSKVLIPYAADGNYHVVAKTDDENVGSSPAIIRNSRSYNLELENLWPPIVQEGESMQDYLGYFDKSWSEQYYLFFRGQPNKKLVVRFTLPLADTFAMTMWATKGLRFGDYKIQIDNLPPVSYFGYEARDWGDPIRSGPISFGTHFLPKGEHLITFECTGGDPATTHENLLGADNLLLEPVTTFHPRSGVPLLPVGIDRLAVYPNPVTNTLHIFVGVDTTNRLLDAEIVDVLGNVHTRFADVLPHPDGVLTLPLAGLSPGQYYIRLTQNGASIGDARFVKF
jgi:hypothetical protein